LIFEFDGAELDLGRYHLRREGRSEPVEPQVFALLAVLVRERHRVVSKEELLDTVWGNRFVSESALTSRVKSARRAIGDDGRGQRLIRTVHGRGYQFVGDVVERGTVVPGPAAGPVPAQLPMAVRGFAGRVAELARLDGLLTGAGPAPSTVVISAVSGAPGVGKTSLALHWAHRVSAQFPDGQLYVNLRGFDPGGSVMEPAEAVRGLLDALAVAAERIPPGLDAQVALYRSTLAGRRLLVVLDNARDAEQVRPLLPGTPGCLVVVTSRDRLTPLVAAQGAYPLALDLLPADEARELLARRLGAERVAAEPAAVDEIITRCGRLPLALGIAAAHATTRPHNPLAAEAAQLRDAAGGLDAFDGGDPTTDARVVFSWSYRALSPGAARLFRLLGLHGGPDIAVPAAASLAGLGPTECRALLVQLVRANLLTEPVPGRYRLHDLLRAYAAELLQDGDPDGDRRAAVRRVLDHYVHTAHAAAMLQNAARPQVTLTTPAPDVTVTPHADHEAARSWFAAEHAVLMGAMGTACAHGLDRHVWTLAWALTTYLDWHGQWYDRHGRAHAHRDIGRTYCQLGQYADGRTHLHQALDLYRSVGDPVGEARTLMSLSWMLQAQGHHREALDHIEWAKELFRAAGDQHWFARSLNATGWLYIKLGRHRQAHDRLQQALELAEKMEDRHSQASTWDSLGYVHQHMEEPNKAEHCYQQALRLYRETGYRYGEADTLARLGDTRAALGDHESAHQAWERSLDILQRLDHPEAAAVRRRLRGTRSANPAAGPGSGSRPQRGSRVDEPPDLLVGAVPLLGGDLHVADEGSL